MVLYEYYIYLGMLYESLPRNTKNLVILPVAVLENCGRVDFQFPRQLLNTYSIYSRYCTLAYRNEGVSKF